MYATIVINYWCYWSGLCLSHNPLNYEVRLRVWIDLIANTLTYLYYRQLERELEASRQLVIKQLHLANQDGPMDQNMAISPPKLSQEPVFRNTKTKIDPSEIPRSHFNETILDSIDSTNQRHSMTADQDYARLTKGRVYDMKWLGTLPWLAMNNNTLLDRGQSCFAFYRT